MSFILCVLFALCFVERPQGSYGSWRPRVAIVGAGIGGSTTAYFLRQALGDDVEITIYDKDGGFGRVGIIKIGDHRYESGGAVLHPGNQYMANLTKAFGLKHAKDFPYDMSTSTFPSWGLYDGSKIVFQTFRSMSEEDSYNRFFQRYENDLYLGTWVDDLVKLYEKIYAAQKGGRAFETVYDMFHFLSSDFDGMMSSTIGDYMKHLGHGERFMKEWARVAMRINYGQDLDIQGFVGAISLAGVQGQLWSVEGGNHLVAANAWTKSKAQRKKRNVTELKEITSGGRKHFLLTHKDPTKSDAEPVTEQFDAVVLALPCTKSGCGGIDFSVNGIENELTKFPTSYHTTVANFVKGKLNATYFKTTEKDLPDSIWSVAEAFPEDAVKFMSIDRQIPVDYGTKHDDPQQVSDLDVYKIFTSTPMTSSQIDKLFEPNAYAKSVSWKAYPNYDEVPTDPKASLPSFVLDSAGGLISVNAIESTASAMEQSIVGAKNAAILIEKYLKSREISNYLPAYFGWQDFSKKPCESIENAFVKTICLTGHGRS